MRRLRLPRWGAAGVCTGLVCLLLCALLFLVGWRLWYETALLLKRLPGFLATLPDAGAWLEGQAYRFIIAAPVSMQDFLWQTLDSAMAQTAAVPNQLYQWLVGAVTAAVTALPDWGLFLFTAALATFFVSSGRPALLSFFRRQLPPAWRKKVQAGGKRLKATFGGWLRAQGMLMLITFAQLAAGFFLLGVDYALLLAALVALVDALPVFGTGTVLVPWAAVALLMGNVTLAVGLAVLYAVVFVVRSLLEPKLVGDRVGLPPLAALMSMYVGFQALGVAGMVLAPLIAMFLKELHDCGFVRLWRD